MISRDAFAQEVRALTDTAYAVTYLILGNSADCEDAMSAAILRAFEGRGQLKKRESFRAWFLQILRHEAYTLLRTRRRLTPVEEMPEAAAPDRDDAGRLDLQEALTELTEAQRTAKAEIDKLYSYKGTTHITSEADLDVTYRKDLETMFDKMEELDARLSLLES